MLQADRGGGQLPSYGDDMERRPKLANVGGRKGLGKSQETKGKNKNSKTKENKNPTTQLLHLGSFIHITLLLNAYCIHADSARDGGYSG